LIFTGSAVQGTRNFIVPRGVFHAASNAFISASGTSTALGRDSQGSRNARIVIRNNAVLDLGACSMGGAEAGGWVVVTIQDAASLSTGTNNFDLHNVNRSTSHTTLNLNGGTVTTGGFIKTRIGATQLSTNYFNGGLLRASRGNLAFLPALSGLTAIIGPGGARVDDGNNMISIWEPLLHDPALGATPDGGLTKLGVGAMALEGANTYNGPTMILAGTLLCGPASVTNSSGIYIAQGADLDFSVSGSLSLGSGKTIWGNGTVMGKFTLGDGGKLSPGSNAIGRLRFITGLTLSPGCTNTFELNKFPLTNDVVVSGQLTNGGTLIVTNISTNALGAGDSFKLFDASGYYGSFNSVSLPPLTSGLAWDTNSLSTAGVISVVSISPPVVNSITPLGGGGFRLNFSGPSGQGYEVRATTNVALSPVTLWDLLGTGTFGASPAIYDDLEATNYSRRFYLIRIP
jgi:autotransporter-associated beta strand protein